MNTKQLTRPQEIAAIIKNQFGAGALYMIGAYDLFCGSDEKHEEYFIFPIGDPPNTKYFTGELEDNWSEFKN